MDASASGLREVSGRAWRAKTPNLVYIRAAVEALPPGLRGIADRVTVVLPWGSLLLAVAGPEASALRAIRELCQSQAALTIVLAIDAQRDRTELARLGLELPEPVDWRARLAPGYAAAGLELVGVRTLGQCELLRWPSTWARRLGHGQPRPVVELEARAR